MAITKIVIQQINTIDSTNINVGKYPRYVVRLGNSISSITAAELSTAVIAAQGSANAASASATAAKTSETNSKTSETNAKASETAANTSKNAAAASATAAKTSETNSKTSETNSAASAAAALASQNAAKTSETNSKTSETNAKTSETNAAASATAANTSKNAAAASAAAALASQNAAKTSETNSKTSETNSAASAAAAAQSAADAGATVGNVVPIIAGQLSDANTAITTGIYTCNGSTTNIPVAQGGILEVYKRQGANNVVQEFSVVAPSSASVAAKRWVRTSDGSTWTTWQEVFITKSNPPDFGAMGAVPTVLTDFNTAITIGVYSTGASATNGPAGIASGGILEVYTHLSAGNYTQIFHTTTAVAALANRHFVRMFNGTTWSAWAEIYTTANKPTAADVLAVAIKGNISDTTSINTLGTGNNGLWAKGTSTGATVANGFPEEGAVGYLEVIQGGNFGGTQKYTVRNGNIYVRSLTAAWNGTNGPWGPWIRVSATWSIDIPLNSLTTENLNTLGFGIATDKATVYYQTANARATADNNYPEGFGGTLTVLPSAYGCQQRYESYQGRVYYRGLINNWNGVDGPWSEWLGLPMYGYGLNSMPNQTAFDFQQFSWVSGGRYYTPGANVTNMPAGISLAAGTGVTVIVEQLTASGTRATLTVIPDTASDSNFRVYKVLSVGAKGSRVFNVRQEISSADTTLSLTQSPGDTTLVPSSSAITPALQSPALRVSGSAASPQNTFAIQGYAYSTTDFGSNIVGTRSAGTQGVHGAVPAGRAVLTIHGAASDGVQYRSLGRIDFYNVEATSPTSYSGEIRFSTSPTGNTAMALAMTIDNAQNVTMTKNLTVAATVTTREEIISYRQLLSRSDAFSPYTGYNRLDQVEGTAPTAITGVGDIAGRLTTAAGDPWGRLLGNLSFQHNLDNAGRVVLAARNVAQALSASIVLDGGAATVAVTGLLQAGNISATGTMERLGGGTLSFNANRTNAAVNSFYGAQTTAGQVFFGTGSGTNFVINNTQSNTAAWATIDATAASFIGRVDANNGLTVGATRTTSGGIEVGSLTTAVSSYIDFHSSGTGNDFDARIAISGGVAATGKGDIVVTSNSTTFIGPINVNTVGSLVRDWHTQAGGGCGVKAWQAASNNGIELNNTNSDSSSGTYVNMVTGGWYTGNWALGAVRGGSTAIERVQLQVTANSGGSVGSFQFYPNGRFQSEGTISLGGRIITWTSVASTYLELIVDGTAKGMTFFDSDLTLKENVEDADGSKALSIIEQIRPVSYKFKDYTYTHDVHDPDTGKITKATGVQVGDPHQFGVIAQEYELIHPEGIRTASDGKKSLDPLEILGLLMTACHEQQKMIKDLQKDIAELKSK